MAGEAGVPCVASRLVPRYVSTTRQCWAALAVFHTFSSSTFVTVAPTGTVSGNFSAMYFRAS